MPFVRVNYKRIHYRDVAPKDAPKGTILLVHGLGSSQNYYASITPALVAAGYRCISVDTTGSGRSPYTYVEQSITSLAQDMINVLDALGVASAVLVAHSMGGLTAPQAVALGGSRFSSLVLLGPVFPSPEAGPTFAQRIEAVEQHGMDALADTVPYGAVGPSALPLHHAFIRELLLATDPMGYISLCRVIKDAHADPPQFAKVACPLLVVGASEDKSAPVAGCRKLLEAVASTHKELVVLDGKGHWMCVECPDDVAREVLGFLGKLN